jgi:catechol 2,3-dioxygenase-like lactoylglutathione lyase family enzyme
MPLVAIEHVQLAMPPGGEELARGFYRDVLGLAERPKPSPLAERGGCWFEDGAVKIHLGVERDFRPAIKAHPGLLVEDLAALVAACRAAGFVVTADDALVGYERVYVNDPFGNRIELMEPKRETG